MSSSDPHVGANLSTKPVDSLFDPADYWEERLRKNPGIMGVGYTSLSEGFINWQYRIRRRVFLRQMRFLKLDWHAARVLDIGSGTGFYVQLWKELGAMSVTGSDITDIALSRLKEQFPNECFQRLDISTGPPQTWVESFDVVSAFDVLFHIVDDTRYNKAIENISSMLRPGGLFLFSDLFLHGPTQRNIHIVCRPLWEIEMLLNSAGFEIVRKVPMFVIMNQPMDATSRARAFLWKLLVRVSSKSEILGHAFGAILYPLELILTSVLKESASTEVLVCRKTTTRKSLE